ncbi:ABC-F family ATP-binding cassette domain-containing protein [Synechocystis sp. CACIAM 05]|uniref:ABC-F family ATP-binding cassette domain-containing protein n=1 Tax=Synechocystis sp. CACIAM 05 TaxID=1933929 RepID=UPI00138E74E1|nr:ABC-F family ATP-binding cassette domain-containing protein [Synechocystis sp. CACIAM 05]QHV00301.1 multidrug ABC transporter ATP-binding protein [Synechocystis sp. CACIAM 05]
MALITVQSLRKDFGIKEILRDATFNIEAGDRVGLIGVNGSGKSTLLKMIAGLEPFDGGEYWCNSSAKVVYLPQQPEMDGDRTVLEQVFVDSGEQWQLVKQYELLSDKLAHQGSDEQLLNQLSAVSAQMETTGAWELETQAKIVLTQLGVDHLDAKIADLSGGYRKRVAIATALLSQPDVLLMDEPTNHLDAFSVEWLQSYLQRFRGALLLITHDRYFLDRVTNRILEIDQGELYSYNGNYGYYLTKKAEAEESEQSSQKKHRGVLRRELEWLKRGPKARSTKQKARIDRIQDMQETSFKTRTGKVEISTAGRRIGKKVVELENISKGFENRQLIKDFSYIFTPVDRVGIVGKNGVGKSTLMNMITGRLEPDQGTVEIGSTIHFGYFDQHSDDLSLNPNQRVIDYLKSVAELVKTTDGEVITAGQMLERFLFPPNQQFAPISKLSGGEKRRLFLLRVLMRAPNVLILDEPTNDLDVQTLAVLEDYLEDFNGCVIVVSHDRYFLDRTVETIFAFEEEGELRQYPGNYSLYLEYKKAEQVRANQEETESKKSHSPTSNSTTVKQDNGSKKLSYKEKREYEQLEQQIPQLEEEKAQLEAKLYQNSNDNFTELQNLTERLANLSESIDQKTERWLTLAERI